MYIFISEKGLNLAEFNQILRIIQLFKFSNLRIYYEKANFTFSTFLPNKNSEISLSYEQKVKFIQQTLRQNGYNVAIDGKFCKKTIASCNQFLGKKFNSIDEIYEEMLRRSENR